MLSLDGQFFSLDRLIGWTDDGGLVRDHQRVRQRSLDEISDHDDEH